MILEILRLIIGAAVAAVVLCIGLFLVVAILCTLQPYDDHEEDQDV